MKKRVVQLKPVSAYAPIGVIHAIQATHGGPVKIGWVSKPLGLNRRLRVLQCGNPDVLHVVWTTPGSLQDENALHAAHRARRLRGEWFHADVLDLLRLSEAA